MIFFKLISRATVTILLIAGVAGSLAQAQTQAPSIESLQRQINELQRALQALKETQEHQAAQTERRQEEQRQAQIQTREEEAAEPSGDHKVAAAGAPSFSGPGFANFKIRGRLQADFGSVSGQDRFGEPGLGSTSEVRRVRIGAQGDIGDFSYVAEIDFADNNVSVEDAFMVWHTGTVDLIVGQHKPWVSMEEQSDDLFVPFMERAAFTTAFEFGFLLGGSVVHSGPNYSLRAGILSSGSLSGDDTANGYVLSSRANFSPEIGNAGRLHLAASIRHREDPSNSGAVQYRRRPQIHSSDVRFVDTGPLAIDQDTFYGVELGAIFGPFYATAEWGFLTADASVPGAADPDFNGGYIGAGYFFTGESLPYDPSAGNIGGLKPNNPVGQGGMGALAAHIRYDRLDLTDLGAGIDGGEQAAWMIGLTWYPIEYVRFLLNYYHLEVDGGPFAAIANIADPSNNSFTADVIAVRAQIHW